jgi:hypothetical protein
MWGPKVQLPDNPVWLAVGFGTGRRRMEKQKKRARGARVGGGGLICHMGTETTVRPQATNAASPSEGGTSEVHKRQQAHTCKRVPTVPPPSYGGGGLNQAQLPN